MDRLGALYLDEAAERVGVSAVSAVACLYREWRVAGRELERLASGLTRRRLHEGLRALERACVSLRITEGLVELVAREHATGLGEADLLRRELIAEIGPWLEAARAELPAAATVLCSFATDEASGNAAAAALRQLEALLAGTPGVGLSKRRTDS